MIKVLLDRVMDYKNLHVISHKTFDSFPGISTVIDPGDYPMKSTAIIYLHFKDEETEVLGG